MNKLQAVIPALGWCLLLGCGAGETAQPEKASPVQTTIRRTIPAGIESELSLQTLANARCTLREQLDADEAHRLVAYADERGEVLFHVQADPALPTAATHMSLDCQDERGRVQTLVLELQVSDAPSSTLTSRIATSPRQGVQRPALSGDPMAHSQAELLRSGYGLRPNPERAPAAFAQWQKQAALPIEVVSPRLVEHPQHVNSTSSGFCNPNYDGYNSIASATGTPYSTSGNYLQVNGEWLVPTVVPETVSSADYSSIWVGLQGSGLTGLLIQAGTGQDTFTSRSIFGTIRMTSYYAWFELYDSIHNQGEQRISNFPVSPRDRMSVSCWSADSTGTPDVWGGYGDCQLVNLTKSRSVWINQPNPSGTTFDGGVAEWILERPTVGGSLPGLPIFETFRMGTAWVIDSAINEYPYGQVATNLLYMCAGSRQLATASFVDWWTMQFWWHANR